MVIPTRAKERSTARGRRLARRGGNQGLVAQAHVELAIIAMGTKQLPEADRHFSKVLSIGRAIGDRHYEHIGLGNLGVTYVQQQLGTGGIGRMHLENKRVQQGLQMLMQACDIAHEIGELEYEAGHGRNLAQFFLQMFMPYEALEAFERVQILHRELGVQDPSIDELVRGIRDSLGQ